MMEDIKLKRLIKNNNNKNRDSISKVIADGSYDSNENFQFLSSNGIEPAIKVRKNSSIHSKGCYSRKIDSSS